MSEHGECFDIGISGNCGVTCPVFQRGDCEERTELIDYLCELYKKPMIGELLEALEEMYHQFHIVENADGVAVAKARAAIAKATGNQ